VNALPEAERREGAEPLQDYSEYFLIRNLGVFGLIGTVGFITARIAAGIALRDRAAAPVSVVVLLGLSGLLITAHPPPYGPIGLVLFVVAVWLSSEARRRTGNTLRWDNRARLSVVAALALRRASDDLRKRGRVLPALRQFPRTHSSLPLLARRSSVGGRAPVRASSTVSPPSSPGSHVGR
jgi:hypothetical protein